MTKYYLSQELEQICWKLYVLSKDVYEGDKYISSDDKRRYKHAFQILKNLQFQWEMEGKK